VRHVPQGLHPPCSHSCDYRRGRTQRARAGRRQILLQAEPHRQQFREPHPGVLLLGHSRKGRALHSARVLQDEPRPGGRGAEGVGSRARRPALRPLRCGQPALPRLRLQPGQQREDAHDGGLFPATCFSASASTACAGRTRTGASPSRLHGRPGRSSAGKP
jgi:hypothetical protein